VLLGVESQASTNSLITSSELLHEKFERQAALSPESIALVCGPEVISYSEVDRRSNQLARMLQAQGTGRGDAVGILLPRAPDLYIALLGILKSGAAYVPLDSEYPADRVRFILCDCGAAAVVTCNAQVAKIAGFEGRVVNLEELRSELASFSCAQLRAQVSMRDLSYIIYTSGTTGRPKGVAIEHRSVSHLVDAERALFQVQPSDRVYQGFSVAFDASIEEIWLAFCAGAALVAATPSMFRAGPELPALLEAAGVTVLSCVPTLLAMMEQDVPSVRLLILGGEACSAELIKRWWKPNRRVFNTYGPTEATVIATCVECHPDKPITIGRPLPGYRALVVNESLDPVSGNAAGELCLGGIGLARGYVGQAALTREKFVPMRSDDATPEIYYRTGDLARWTSDGELQFLGRVDTQVKVRGYRVELSEIESVLLQHPGVRAAAAALRDDVPGVHQLVTYLVPREGQPLDFELLRSWLRDRLPAYMVPAVIVPMRELPTLPNGKLDRKSLPAPVADVVQRQRMLVAPRTPFEEELVALWQPLFVPQLVSVRDNFFSDLGGHSLLAARVVSSLRKTAGFKEISVSDLYNYPTIEGLAARFEERPPPSPEKPSRSASSVELAPMAARLQPTAVPFWRHFLCGTAQLLALVFVWSFFALQWLAPYLTYTILVEEEYGFIPAVLGAFASLIVLYPVMLAVPILLKWLVIGQYRPGAYPLWGSYYFRFWLVRAVEAAVPVGYLKGTPLLRLYLRLMGANVGRNLQLHTDSFAIYDLLSIGDGSSINADSRLLGYTVENGWLQIGAIIIGQRCFVGARAAVCENSRMDDDSALEDLSLLPPGASMPAGETWRGSPASAVESEVLHSKPETNSKTETPGTETRRFIIGALQGLGLLVFPVLVVAALFPGIIVMNRLNYLDPYYWYLLLAPLAALSFVSLLCLEIAAVKWLLLGKVKPGRYELNGLYYVRKWFVDRMMELSLDVVGPIYASVYLTPWYKLLGAKLGSGAEVSTASFISPDLLSIGAESFIADSVSLGAPRVRDGLMTIGPNQVGKRSFIGNSALLPPGTLIGNNVLIGCLSVPPSVPADALREDSTWLGSPSIFLPQRQRSAAFAEETTFNPAPKLRVQRAAIEFIRVILPSTGFIILTSLLFSALLLLHDLYTLPQTLLFFPLLYIACGLVAVAFTILAKWILIGRYVPGEKPLWSTFVWRNELLNALHEHLAEPFVVDALAGTPFICWYFRLLGARIGRRVYLETADFSEFDLACIGEEAALNADCTVQTHLFEDRVMKMSAIHIGSRCSVGTGSLVLYDTLMEEGSSLGSLSLLMKGEVLPADTHWQGIPARRAGIDRD
jgi:non-ribosomal peptide synthetase-like protein